MSDEDEEGFGFIEEEAELVSLVTMKDVTTFIFSIDVDVDVVTWG